MNTSKENKLPYYRFYSEFNGDTKRSKFSIYPETDPSVSLMGVELTLESTEFHALSGFIDKLVEVRTEWTKENIKDQIISKIEHL